MTRAAINPSDPYGLGVSPEWKPVQRTYPAKDERIAYRWSSFGVAHKVFGVPWPCAGTVHALTERELLVIPANKDVDSLHRVALDLSYAWEWAYAIDVTFFRRCETCGGQGEKIAKPAAVCAACMGRQLTGGKWCEACNGFGFLPGSDLMLDCLDCVAGARTFDPFTMARRPKRERERERQQQKSYIMPPQTEFYEPPF